LMHPLVFPVEVAGAELAPCDGETAADAATDAATVPAADAATEAAAEGLTLGEAATVAAGDAALEGLATGEAETGLLELETWACVQVILTLVEVALQV